MLTERLNDVAASAGLTWFDYQQEVFDGEASVEAEKVRVCLYHATGKGKTLTSLGLLAFKGADRAVVIAPPSTHKAWVAWGHTFGIDVEAMSHARFRMKDTKLKREVPVVVDEFHMLGGHSGKGFSKMDGLAVGLRAPLIICSATPNYNDAERVYCVQHVLDPLSCRGGYIAFLYAHCETEADRYSMTPKVIGFRNVANAEEYLAALPHVYYVPDTVQYKIVDDELAVTTPAEWDEFNFDRKTFRIMASTIEKKHKFIQNSLIGDDGSLSDPAWAWIESKVENASGQVMVYATHETVAKAVANRLYKNNVKHGLVTGKVSKKFKDAQVEAFKDGVLDVLVGTASVSTGTDGLDKVCNTLLILDDTDDDAARRQLVGRILPRGQDTDATMKEIYRLLLTST